VATIAALLAGVVASAVIDDGEDDAVSDQPGEATLSTAEQVPDVPLERFDGTPLSIADYRGQALVVNFWGSWCQPCVKEMPDLQRVHESLGDDVAFLGVNVRDNDPADALEMIERTGVTYDVAIDPDGELIRELGVVNFPTTVLILPDGTIVDAVQRQISAERLCDKINQSLLSGQLEECG
jgi:thiol-disulfide isomerase/thioredoxin